MTTKSPGNIYYMYGRFQPFTTGHLSLFEQMLKALQSLDGENHAYLFVSYSATPKSQAPRNTKKIRALKIIIIKKHLKNQDQHLIHHVIN